MGVLSFLGGGVGVRLYAAGWLTCVPCWRCDVTRFLLH